MKILAVDDDDIALEVLSEALRRQGHDVVTAMDGRQALDLLRDGTIRMVVCDWMMPRMDGIQLCEALRKGSSEGYVYIILVTGRDNPDSVVKGLSAGADDFMHKPFEVDKLIERMCQLLDIEAVPTV